MKHYLLIALATIILPSAHAEPVGQENSTEEKVYIFRSEKVNGKTGEIEIHFPKGHAASKAKGPAVIMFHGSGAATGHRLLWQ